MTASSPVTARGTPPDTGASTIRTPNGCRPAASSSVSDGSDELISTSSAPSRRAVPIPQPSIASRTIAPLGSIVTTRPADANASGEAAATAPGCSAANWSCFAASMSRTTSRKPAACRFLAIGQPMLPRPTKPTVTCCSGTLIAIAAAFLLLSSASIVIAGRPADQIQPRNDSICGTNAAWSWNRKAWPASGKTVQLGARDQAGEGAAVDGRIELVRGAVGDERGSGDHGGPLPGRVLSGPPGVDGVPLRRHDVRRDRGRGRVAQVAAR